MAIGDTNAVAITAAANAAASTAAVIESADQRVDAVIDAANERVAAAEENAERIAEAALEGERGRRIADLEQEVTTCRENNRILASDLQAMASRLSEMEGKLTALLTLEIIAAAMQSSQASTPAPSSSTPPTLEAAATTAAEELDPSNLSLVAEAASPVVATSPARKKRVI